MPATTITRTLRIMAAAAPAGVLAAAIIFAGSLPGQPQQAQDDNAATTKTRGNPMAELEAELLIVVQRNIAGLNREELATALSAFHPDGPGYPQAKVSMERTFPVADLDYKLVGFHLIGSDKDYAVARFTQTMELVGDTQVMTTHRRSEVDMLTAFRRLDDRWLIWTSAMLETKMSE